MASLNPYSDRAYQLGGGAAEIRECPASVASHTYYWLLARRMLVCARMGVMPEAGGVGEQCIWDMDALELVLQVYEQFNPPVGAMAKALAGGLIPHG